MVKTQLEKHFIQTQEEFNGLKKMALIEIDEDDSNLDNAIVLSAFTSRSIKHLSQMPKNNKWYYSSPYKTLKFLGIGNCKNYAESLIALSYVVGIDGRKIYISGMVDAEGDRPKWRQGHVLCELKIDGNWVIFDAMYGVPDIGEATKHHLKDEKFKLPSAYDCWKDPDRYIAIIKPELRKLSKMFWRQIWVDFLIGKQTMISEIGEEVFIEKWYGKPHMET